LITIGAGFGGIVKALGAEKAFITLLGGSVIVPEVIENYPAIKAFLTTYPNNYILFDTIRQLF